MPFINPLRPPNTGEVMRREKALRQELLHDEAWHIGSGYDDSWSCPRGRKRLIRRLARFIAGRSDRKDR